MNAVLLTSERTIPSTISAIDDSVEVLLSIGATLEPDYDIRVATSSEEGLALAATLRRI